MRRQYEPPAAAASGVSLRLCVHPPELVGHARAELRPRRDAELAVRARQVRLDGLWAHEGGARDLAVRHSRRGELGDAALGRGQLGRRAAEADAAELCLGLLGPRRRAEPLEDRGCLAERVGGGAPLLEPAVQAPLDEPIPREVEREPRRLVEVEVVERGERRRDVALSREDERARARERDADPEPGKDAPALLEAHERLAGALAHIFDAVCARDCLGTVWMARRDVDSNLAARFRNAIQAAAVWANQEDNERASGAILAKYSELDPALIAKVTRTRFATRLRPELAQPWIDLYAEFGVLPSSFPAIDLTK